MPRNPAAFRSSKRQQEEPAIVRRAEAAPAADVARGPTVGKSSAAIPRSRRPVPSPVTSSTWEDELWKLRRLYSGGGPFDVEYCEGGSRIVRLTHHCTDPDWEAVNWAPEGLQFELHVPAAYPETLAEAPSLQLTEQSGSEALPERFVQVVPLVFAESVGRALPSSPAVYRGLQAVDRHLAPIWLKIREAAEREELQAEVEAARAERAKAEAERQQAEKEEAERAQAARRKAAANAAQARARAEANPWTHEEQAKLEAALATHRGEADTKRRWQLISEAVGNGRSARDCAERFKACRDFAMGKTESPEVRVEEEEKHESGSRPEQEVAAEPAPAAASGFSASEVRRMGLEVRLLGLELEGLATLIPRVLRLEVVCGRCRKPADLSVEKAQRGLDVCSAEMACPVCKQQLAVQMAPSICHGGCPTIAHVLGVSCHPIQLLRSDFEAECGECTVTTRINNAGPGYRKKSACHSCATRLFLSVQGCELLGLAVAHWRQVAEEEGAKMTARRQLQEARLRERELGIQVGQPLPERGTCKHLQKSYRWLRFPCCGRAFPCPSCHDEQMDHPHEWANRMLCGLCSHEQPFSKDQCTYCGASQTRSRSTFWEGGDGCRNRTKMAKNDPHKFKGLGKTVSRSKSSKDDKR